MSAELFTSSDARHDLAQYARAMRTGNHSKAVEIEERWDLYGYPPEIVSTVLACVATGLSLEGAIAEATDATTPSPSGKRKSTS